MVRPNRTETSNWLKWNKLPTKLRRNCDRCPSAARGIRPRHVQPPWFCSTEDCYGPDELGEYANALEDMTQNVNKCDAAARIWEVLQAWEQRLFRRNYHFLNAGWKGWGMFGGSSGTSGASILQTQNAMKLFSCNIYGARHKKITRRSAGRRSSSHADGTGGRRRSDGPERQ